MDHETMTAHLGMVCDTWTWDFQLVNLRTKLELFTCSKDRKDDAKFRKWGSLV